jgi:hypothetical protein
MLVGYNSRMMYVGIIANTLKWFGGLVIMKNDNVNGLCSWFTSIGIAW